MSEPAFPSTEAHPAYDFPQHFHGMSMRDWFAGQALSGLLASGTWTNSGAGFEDHIARHAGNIADAMMENRLT